MASTFWRFERFGRLRSYVRPFVRSLCPLTLMKSGGRDSHQKCELCAQSDRRVFPVFDGGRCRSSRLFALAKLEPAIFPLECLLQRRAASLRFANVSARKPSPVFIIAKTIRANLLANATRQNPGMELIKAILRENKSGDTDIVWTFTDRGRRYISHLKASRRVMNSRSFP